MTGFAQQLYKQYYTDAGTAHHGVFYPKTVYHFYTYVFAAVILLAALIGYRLYTRRPKSDEATSHQSIFAMPWHVVLHVFVMAICLFGANYLQTVATNDFGMHSQVLYPIIKGGCLITVNITAMLFFGERITKRSALGSFVALVGIVCMNLL